MAVADAALYAVRDRASLFAFLRGSLHWPVDSEDTFTYAGPQLHGDVATRAEVSQIVPFTAGDPFTIMLVEFDTPFRRTDLREILRRMREEIRKRAKYGGRKMDEIVFVVATENYSGLRFVRFEERPGRAPRLSTFGWQCRQPEGTRTLREINLPALMMPPRNLLSEYDWSQARWADAWNVEKVTDEFFRLYAEVFAVLMEAVKGARGDRRLVTQRLCNRLMFVQFLSKKGWLNRDRNYLRALYEVARDYAIRPGVPASARANFYPDYLWPLFFKGLNTPTSERLYDAEWSALSERLGDVPFLNGGLFAAQDADENLRAVTIPNDAFVPLLDLFDRFNFTLTESTPDDVEVAVDPEMLGKVFEELVTAEERHGTGSYYTPRGIVAFMCREALKGYLSRDRAQGDVARFVDEGDPSGLRDPETVLEALKTVTVCDPACGSGAYLLGMMQELLRLREGLFAAKAKDHRRIYDRKLEIIQRNLYGVDKEPFAVNIAMLRLWLSLMVDDERNPLDDPTVDVSLPNLRFKIQQGDALTAPMPDLSCLTLFGDAFSRDAARLWVFHDEYFTPPHHNRRKRAKEVIEADIEAEQKKIADLLGSHAQDGAVDWCVRFAEVFAPTYPVANIGGGLNLGTELAEEPKSGGFDIAIANPPYVRQELISDLKPALQTVYPEVYTGTADLYVFFYARALQLLRNGGVLTFISSNKWFKAAYGAKLRTHIAATTAVQSITDFGELPVFQSAATFPMIIVTWKVAPGNEGPIFTQVKTLEPPYPDVLAIIKEQGQSLPAQALSGSKWTLTGSASADRLRKMENAGVQLGEYVGARNFRGIMTGFNSAFILDSDSRERLIRTDPRCSDVIKKLVIGDDVRKWSIRSRERWLLFIPWDFPLDRYPVIREHLERWKEPMSQRPEVRQGRYKWYCMGRYGSEYHHFFAVPKIVYPEIAMEQRFAFDVTGAYTNNKAFIIPTTDLYLLGLLNSASAWSYAKATCAALGDEHQRGRLMLQWVNFQRLPVPSPPDTDRAAISALVQKCLDAKGVGCEAWEQEINERVAALYGL